MTADEAREFTDKANAELEAKYDKELAACIKTAEESIGEAVKSAQYWATAPIPTNRRLAFKKHFEVVLQSGRFVISWYKKG